MKGWRMRWMFLVMALCGALLSTSCESKSQNGSPKAAQATSSAELNLKVSGMTCSGCEQTIRDNVMKLPGIVDAKAEHSSGKVVVKLSGDPAELRQKIVESINALGSYRVEQVELVQGTH